jgi:hypothetical protein
MKKILFSIFISLFVFPLSSIAFNDVENHLNQDAIDYLKENNVVQGYGDGTYRPDELIDRAEFLKIVLESLSTDLDNEGFCFLDVESDWYATYVCKAKTLGIVSGYADGNFRPGDDINLAESLKIILEAYNASLNYNYSNWYEPYYYFMQENGLLNLVSESLSHKVTRGEMAQLIFNLDNLYEQEPEPEYSYNIYDTTNVAEGFGFIDDDSTHFKEEPLPVIAVVRENVKVLVPEGYEDVAKAHVEDLITCQPLLSDFFGGVAFPKDELLMKIYVSTDDSNRGSHLSGKIIYRRSQVNIDIDLQMVLTNSPEGFLYNSGSDYCANTHELTHAFFSESPIPSFGDEGLAQFTQKHNQGDIYDNLDCQSDGYYSYDEWNIYSDMSPENILDYNTAMCFIEELVNTYGWSDFYAMLARLDMYQTEELVWDKFTTYHFIKDILEYVYSSDILGILSKYGIEEEDYIIE